MTKPVCRAFMYSCYEFSDRCSCNDFIKPVEGSVMAKKRLVSKETAALLRQVKRGDVRAAYRLGDHLRENELPLAAKIGGLLETHKSRSDYWKASDFHGKKLSRNEVLRRVDNHLIRTALKAFGPVTTVDQNSPEKREKALFAAVRTLAELRRRIERLEKSCVRRSEKILRASRKRCSHRLVVCNGTARGVRVNLHGTTAVVVGHRVAFRIPASDEAAAEAHQSKTEEQQ